MKFHLKFAVKDSIGGWKDNAHIIKFPTGCTAFKDFMPNEWLKLMAKLNITNPKCPIAQASDMCLVLYVEL